MYCRISWVWFISKGLSFSIFKYSFSLHRYGDNLHPLFSFRAVTSSQLSVQFMAATHSCLLARMSLCLIFSHPPGLSAYLTPQYCIPCSLFSSWNYTSNHHRFSLRPLAFGKNLQCKRIFNATAFLIINRLAGINGWEKVLLSHYWYYLYLSLMPPFVHNIFTYFTTYFTLVSLLGKLPLSLFLTTLRGSGICQ